MKLMLLGRAWSRSSAVRLAAAVSLGVLSLGAMAEDDPPGRVGRVANVEGQVWMLEAGQGEWFELQRNRPFTTGDRIATDKDAKVELQIGSTTVRLDEGSDLDVTRLDDDRIDLTLHDGAAALRVREPEVVPEVQLVTPEGGFTPRAPGLFRIDRGDRGTFAGVMQGDLQFESKDSQFTLRAGQRAEFWLDERDSATHYTWASMPNDEFGQWVAREDAEDSRYAVQQRPISPEMTGAEDLDRNGQWDTHPEYGSVWYPTTVVAGWAPYRYGRWTWVRPWGWTWVDDASWGFAPFHYGRWVNWRSRWVWAPGQYVRRPVYAPAMVAWVGGSHASVSISLGGRSTPAVGWVPLAPREVYYPSYRTSPVYIQKVNVTKVYIDRDRDRDPRRPIMYTNRGVPGGITVVSQNVLTQRQPVAAAQRPADSVVMRQFRDQRAGPDAPPPPANASNAPRVVRTVNDVRREPRPPIDRSTLKRVQDMRVDRDRDIGRREPGQAVPGRPGLNNGAAPARGTTSVPVAPVGGAAQAPERPAVRPAAPSTSSNAVGQRPAPVTAPQERAERPERPQRPERELPGAATPQAPATSLPQRVREPQESPRRDLRQEPREPQRELQRETPRVAPQLQSPAQPQPRQPVMQPAQPAVQPQRPPAPVREVPTPPQVPQQAQQQVPQQVQQQREHQRELREQQREQREQQREQRESQNGVRRDVR